MALLAVCRQSSQSASVASSVAFSCLPAPPRLDGRHRGSRASLDLLRLVHCDGGDALGALPRCDPCELERLNVPAAPGILTGQVARPENAPPGTGVGRPQIRGTSRPEGLPYYTLATIVNQACHDRAPVCRQMDHADGWRVPAGLSRFVGQHRESGIAHEARTTRGRPGPPRRTATAVPSARIWTAAGRRATVPAGLRAAIPTRPAAVASGRPRGAWQQAPEGRQYPPQAQLWDQPQHGQQAGYGQPPWPPQQPGYQPRRHLTRRKSWPARHKELSGLIAFIGLVAIAAAIASALNSPSKPAADTGGGALPVAASAGTEP